MKKLHIFDTSVASDNVGDEIIVDSSLKQLRLWEKPIYLTNSASHVYPGDYVRDKLLKDTSLALVTGSNLLTDMYSRTNLFRLTRRDAKAIEKRLVIFGAGWKSLPVLGDYPLKQRVKQTIKYYGGWRGVQRSLYKTILSDTMLHCVRSKFAVTKLAEMEVNNVLWTACPTMWNLTADHCAKVPKEKCDEVVFAITSYKQLASIEKVVLKILDRNYKVIHFWPQCYEDLVYFNNHLRSLVSEADLRIITPNLKSYDKALSETVDYVGSRLHGGIRSLQHCNRTIILAVDSRAHEIGKDTGLPVILMDEVETKLEPKIQSNFETTIDLPVENIQKFIDQFDIFDS